MLIGQRPQSGHVERTANVVHALQDKYDNNAFQVKKVYSFIGLIYPAKQGGKNKSYRLIVMFLSTEIFSKRRKICPNG